ncbi:MAG: hypothetical protein JST84_33715 [Acidobacteria bacterium]|nr:hypothetical protein [Acidobacteriota bacterium]
MSKIFVAVKNSGVMLGAHAARVLVFMSLSFYRSGFVPEASAREPRALPAIEMALSSPKNLQEEIFFRRERFRGGIPHW